MSNQLGRKLEGMRISFVYNEELLWVDRSERLKVFGGKEKKILQLCCDSHVCMQNGGVVWGGGVAEKSHGGQNRRVMCGCGMEGKLHQFVIGAID
jgi:hypothetical protein